MLTDSDVSCLACLMSSAKMFVDVAQEYNQMYKRLGASCIWTPLKFKWQLRSFRVTHYIILKVILYALYELNSGKLQFLLISFVKHIEHNVHDDTKWSWVSLKFEWRDVLYVNLIH